MRWLLLISYCALIYLLSDQSRIPMPDLGITWQDKVIHFLAYALMAWLFWYAAERNISSLYSRLIFTLLFCLIYGASDEWHQSFVPGRDASIYDWVADALGALLLTIGLYKREVKLLKYRGT